MGSKDSLMHHNKTSCCMLLWNLGSVQGRPGAQGFRNLAPLRMSAFISCPKQLWGPFLTSLPSQSAAQLREKITEAVMFVKNVYETASKETWSLATTLIAADYSGPPDFFIFFRQECQLLTHSRTSGFSAETFDKTFYSMPGWRGSGLLDRFAVLTGTSWIFLEISSDISASWAHQSTSLDIHAGNGIWSCLLYSNFGRRPHFWLSFSKRLLFLYWLGQQSYPIPYDAATVTKIFHLRKNSRCLKNGFAFAGQTRHIIWQTCFTWMSFQTCCWRGYLPGCFNAPNFPLTRLQFSICFPII